MENLLLLRLYCCYLCFFLLLTINGVHTTTYVCGDENFSPNTTYDQNLEALLPSLASKVITEGGFYNASLGRVYALSLCRKHYGAQDCRRCVDRASRNLLTQCQGKTEAYHWDSETFENVSCLVRYSNIPTFGKLKLEPLLNIPHSNVLPSLNVTRISQEFSARANQTLEVASKADESSVLKYYGVSSAEFTDIPEVYMLMQCTPDLSSADCYHCLKESVAYNQEENQKRKGGTVARPSCYFRWDDYSFAGAFDELERVAAPPGHHQHLEDSPVKRGRIFQPWSVVVIVIPLVIYLVVFVAFFLAYRRMQRRFRAQINDSSGFDGQSMIRFNLDMILIATNEFSLENKLGQGGFGSVYKAWKRWVEGEPESIIDTHLREHPINEIIKLIQIGLLCVQENAANRPTMNSVIIWLARDGTFTIPKPTEAAFVTLPLSVRRSMNKSKDKDSKFSVDEVSISVLYPR
ncbi:hypothetical protein YC2023_107466 [Brassica napus]